MLDFMYACTNREQAHALAPLQRMRVRQYYMRDQLGEAHARLLLSIQFQMGPSSSVSHRCLLHGLEQIAATVQAVYLNNLSLIVLGTVADIHSLQFSL